MPRRYHLQRARVIKSRPAAAEPVRYREKIVDRAITYQPTFDSNFGIIFLSQNQGIRDVFRRLNLNNIRVFQQALWCLQYFDAHLTGHLAMVQQFREQCVKLSCVRALAGRLEKKTPGCLFHALRCLSEPRGERAVRKCRDAQPIRFRTLCIMVREPSRQPGKPWGSLPLLPDWQSRVARVKAAFISPLPSSASP